MGVGPARAGDVAEDGGRGSERGDAVEARVLHDADDPGTLVPLRLV